MTAQTGSVDVNPRSAYLKSFGMTSMAPETRYQDVLKGFDARSDIQKSYTEKMEAHMKALGPTAPNNTGDGGTGVLVPIYPDSRVVDISRKHTPARELIPRVTNMGLTADYNRITAKGSAVTAQPDAALTEADNTYARESEPIKFIYSVGRILGPSQAAIPPYALAGFQPDGGLYGNSGFSDVSAPNGMQLEVLTHARAIMEKEEDLIFNGDSSSDATEFDGLIAQQSTTNQVDVTSAGSGGYLQWSDVENAIELAYEDGGRPNVAFASPGALTRLRAIVQDKYRYNPSDYQDSLSWGIPPALVLETMVGPIPVYPSRFLSNSTGSQQICFIDTEVVEMRVLQDITFERLAKTNDSDKFMLKEYACLINRAPEFCSFIDNIDDTATAS